MHLRMLRPTEHSAFHSKPLPTTGKAAITNVSTTNLFQMKEEQSEQNNQ